MARLSSLIPPCYTLNLFSFLCTRRRRSPQHLVGQHKDLGITLSPVLASFYAAVLMHTDDIRTHLTPLVEELREHKPTSSRSSPSATRSSGVRITLSLLLPSESPSWRHHEKCHRRPPIYTPALTLKMMM